MKSLSYIHLYSALVCIYLACQGFACASAEMTSAKISFNSKDYHRSRESLQKELLKNPNNPEAASLLAQTSYQLQDFVGALESVELAEKNAIEDKTRNDMSALRYLIWQILFTKSVTLYNANIGVDQKDFSSAIGFLKLAIRARAENPETYSLLGNCYESSMDDKNAIVYFTEYVNKIQMSIDFLKSQNLILGTSKSNVRTKLGNPISSSAFKPSDAQDSMYVDLYSNSGSDIFFFSSGKQETARFEGIRMNPPKHWHKEERERYFSLTIHPLTFLSNKYYEVKEYDSALAYLGVLESLSPSNDQIQALRVQILINQNKTDEAVKSIELLIARDPNNKINYSNYGELLLKLQRSDEAIVQYEKSLAIDPVYDVALYNVAGVYKSKAVSVQRAEQEKSEKDKKYQINNEKYFPILRKSLEYFERYRKSPNKNEDVGAIEQLINIYEVLGEKSKVSGLISELEMMEPMNLTNNRYYNALAKIYYRQNKQSKGDEALKKAEKIK